MGLIIPGFFGGIPDPIPEGAERDYYFSQQQKNESRENFTRITKQDFLPFLVTLDDGQIVEYSEEKIIGWSIHTFRQAHHLRFKDSVFLGTGKKVEKIDIDQILESLEKTTKKGRV